jgi:hypothetical protein
MRVERYGFEAQFAPKKIRPDDRYWPREDTREGDWAGLPPGDIAALALCLGRRAMRQFLCEQLCGV